MLDDSRTRDDVRAVFDALAPPPLGPETQARVDALLRRLPGSEEAALVGATVDGYSVRGVLGRGGQGTVYLAVDPAGKPCAFKVPTQPTLARLIREAQILFHLDHPHVLRVERARVEGDVPYVVTEHCAQGSLADRLREEGRLPPQEVRRLAADVLGALAYAHERGVVHRDLKPSNVLFDGEGRVRVADFGIGRLSLVEGRQVSGTLVSSDRTLFAGTPLYMAPEQAQRADVDARADLYALGKLLYEALTGLPPRTIKPASRLVPGLSEAWDDYLFVLVAERPDERFGSARAALDALPSAEAPALPPAAAEGPRRAPALAPEPEPEPRPCPLAGWSQVTSLPPLRAALSRSLVAAEADEPRRFAVLEVLEGEDGSPPDPRQRERFLDLARLAANLPRSPWVRRVLGSGTLDDGTPYRLQEHLAGESLAAWRTRTPRASAAQALRFVRHVAHALQAFHEAGRLHLSLTPRYLHVTPGEVVAVELPDLYVPVIPVLDRQGTLGNLPLHNAPEVGRVPKLDGRADLYGLGLVWYELVAGHHPFAGFTGFELISGRAHDRMRPLSAAAPQLPSAHATVLSRLLEKDRDARYADAAALLRDLDVLAGLAPRAAAPPPLGLWGRFVRALRGGASDPPPPRDDAPISSEALERLDALLRPRLLATGAVLARIVDAEGRPLWAGDDATAEASLQSLVATALACSEALARRRGEQEFTTTTCEGPGTCVRVARVDPGHLLLLGFAAPRLAPEPDAACRALTAAAAAWFRELRDLGPREVQ